MRKVLTGFVAIVILCVFASIAFAGGYRSYDSGDKYTINPHGGYTTTTNKCKTCHAVHGATGTYKLLRSNNANTACDFCHIGSGAHSNVTVYTVSSPSAEHTIGTTSIPDSNKSISEFVCATCHSVHGANVISGTKILKKDPAGDGGEATTETTFCADCHDKNYTTSKNGISHVMKAADGTYAFASSEDCVSCHTASDDFPHTSAGYVFLKSGASSTQLDTVCLDCHQSGSSGVGLTY